MIMSIIYNPLLSPKLIKLPQTEPAKNPTFMHPSLFSPNNFNKGKKRDILSPSVASISAPIPDVEYLESEFSGHGVSFAEISDSCIVRMKLENGSLAHIMLPSGLITSYKAQMWHGGIMELLHTTVSEGENGASPVVQGGMFLELKCENGEEEISWSPSYWALNQVTGSPQDEIQVELISRNSEGLLEAKQIISLREDGLHTEIKISNSTDSSINLMASIQSHLTVSTPEATYAVGLQGSDFFSRPPIELNFSILPPGFGDKNDQDSQKAWSPSLLLSNWGVKRADNAAGSSSSGAEEELEGEEEDNYKHLTEEMSKIYTSAPRDFTIIDRGRRNSVIVGGDGFKEMYLLSPGSRHDSYSKYSYICVGHTALLEAIVLKSQGRWEGEHRLHNPNL